MIRLVDPTKEHEFTPESEKGKPDAISFFVVPMTMGQVVNMSAGATAQDGGFILNIEKVLKTNIKMILIGGGWEYRTKQEIANFVDSCGTPEGIAIMKDVFRFIQSFSLPTEDEAKN